MTSRRYEWIIHEAFERCRDVQGSSLAQVVRDNLLLTERLLEVECDVFVFVSSIDVYPRNDVLHTEDEQIDAARITGLYGITKLMAESLVRSKARRYIILRPGLLLGQYMRQNTVSRIASGDIASHTLAAESTFYLVGYAEIWELISQLLARGMTGIYNAVRKNPVSLSDVAEVFGCKPKFGEYRYIAGNISNENVANLVPAFQNDSSELLKRYFNTERLC